MKKLTREQIETYVRTTGLKCPFCGSHDIEGGSFDMDISGAYQDIGCLNCDERWIDKYALVDVLVQEDEA